MRRAFALVAVVGPAAACAESTVFSCPGMSHLWGRPAPTERGRRSGRVTSRRYRDDVYRVMQLMKPDPTRFEISGIWSLVLVLALLGAACGGPGPAVGAQADQQVGQTADEPDSTSDGSNENAESVSPAESEDRSGESGPGTTIEVDILTTIMEEALAPPELPAEATDLSLGGTPDTASAAAIAAGLEDAGVVLDGITLSVLPVSGIGVSLLVLEMSDEYLEKALPGDDDGADMTETLLALPEILSASIVEFVTIYRGVDETGPFTMTFAVSISDLRTAHEAGTEIGDELVVQYERGS